MTLKEKEARISPPTPAPRSQGQAPATSLPARVAVLGLGYVGLPLAQALGRQLPTLGFDINEQRVADLSRGINANDPSGAGDAPPAPMLSFSCDRKSLAQADFFIIAVPTPVDRAKRPDLSFVEGASRIVGQALALRKAANPAVRPATVVYESTVYPGCTEEICVPILLEESGLTLNVDFAVGYSPERINPGDREHTLDRVVKVVSAQNREALELVARVYGLVVKAGVYRAPDIRTAEAAKVIENIQRDLNIALMNELSMLFHEMRIDLGEVLKAAHTKWNFLPFQPGLVGGHCIPEDPYYLTHKAQEIGYHPEVILAGRRINDAMGTYVARETIKGLILTGKIVRGAKALVLGATFKENVRDTRNTRVVDLVAELREHKVHVLVHDPLLSAAELEKLGLDPAPDPFETWQEFDAVILAVPHEYYCRQPLDRFLGLMRKSEERGVLVDVKGIFRDRVLDTPIFYWTL